jgi:hypothetical protein
MRGWWLLSVCLLAAAGTACGDSDDGDGPQTVTAIGLFEFQLPESWSVIVPTITEDELVPVLSVGTDGLPVEERVGVILFDGTVWETLEEAANEWRERSSVALDFESFEADGIAHLRDEFTVTNGNGEPTAVSIINILAHPERPDESWVVVVCGSGPDRMDEARDACGLVLDTLQPWELPELDP